MTAISNTTGSGKAMDRHYVEHRDGGYWVAGTRVSLDSVVQAFLEGLSPETIATECFPVLSLEQAYGAITFYLAHREEMDRYLKQADAEFDAFRQAALSANAPFHARLVQARRQLQLSQP